MQVKKQQFRTRYGTTDWYPTGKGVCQGYILLPYFLTYMQSTSCEMLGRMNHKLESGLLGKISTTQIWRWYHSNGTKWRGTKQPLDEVKEETEKAGLKFNMTKTNITASSSITSWQTNGEKVETVTDFIFLGSKITADDNCSNKNKRCLFLGRKAMTNLDSVFKSSEALCQQRSV